MGRVIWNKPSNPSSYVSDRLGIDRRRLKRAIHKIKAASDLGGNDQVIIHDDGDVTNANGELIGNIFNED